MPAAMAPGNLGMDALRQIPGVANQEGNMLHRDGEETKRGTARPAGKMGGVAGCPRVPTAGVASHVVRHVMRAERCPGGVGSVLLWEIAADKARYVSERQ